MKVIMNTLTLNKGMVNAINWIADNEDWQQIDIAEYIINKNEIRIYYLKDIKGRQRLNELQVNIKNHMITDRLYYYENGVNRGADTKKYYYEGGIQFSNIISTIAWRNTEIEVSEIDI